MKVHMDDSFVFFKQIKSGVNSPLSIQIRVDWKAGVLQSVVRDTNL